MCRVKLRLLLIILALSAVTPAAWAQQNRLQGILTASSTSCSAQSPVTTSCISITMPPDAAGVSVQLSGTFSATVQFESSVDGSNWVSLPGTSSATFIPVVSSTGTGIFQFSSAALVGFRVRCSTYSSGAVQVIVSYGLGAPTINPTFATQNVGTTNTVATGGNPTSVSAGASAGNAADLGGDLFVRTGSPNTVNCYARGVSNALTDFTQVSGSAGCGSQTAAGFKLYITDITAASTTSTGGSFRLSYGTGAACVTTNNALFPANTSDLWNYPPNSAGTNPLQITFNQPLVTSAAQRLCVFGTATNTLNISVSGYIAP
jgi:hypothetical protein